LNSDVRFVLMLAIIIASAIMGRPNLTTCPKNRKHYMVSPLDVVYELYRQIQGND
jgi:hypothetical protein